MVNLSVNLYLFTLETVEIKSEFEMMFPKESKVIDFLYELSYRFPKVKIIDEKGISHVLCIINNTAVALNEVLKDGDNISVFPLIDGG